MYQLVKNGGIGFERQEVLYVSVVHDSTSTQPWEVESIIVCCNRRKGWLRVEPDVKMYASSVGMGVSCKKRARRTESVEKRSFQVPIVTEGSRKKCPPQRGKEFQAPNSRRAARKADSKDHRDIKNNRGSGSNGCRDAIKTY
jgi:hypothetical protein